MSIEIKKHMALLGHKVTDRVTGFKGVVGSISFDLYGCIQASVNPGVQKDGKLGEQFWFDVARLNVETKAPVMAVPDFNYGEVAEGRKGAAEKPRSCKP